MSQICPYCGGRMNRPPATAIPLASNTDEDEDEDDDVVGVALTVAAIETVFSDDDVSPADSDPSLSCGGFDPGGGSFGGGGSDEPW